MTLEEARKVVETVSEKLSPDAKVIWGAQIYEDLTKTIRALMIVTGVKSPQILGLKKEKKLHLKPGVEEDFGFEFI